MSSEPKKPVRSVIFDCDGVLFDSTGANRAYYDRILAHMGRPPLTAEQFAFAHMSTADQAIAYLFPEKGDFRKAQEFRMGLGYGSFISLMEMEPDLMGLLDYLKAQSLITAISTNRADTMGRVLEEHGLAGRFDLVVTALDVQNPKPHPESLLRVLDSFSLSPDEALYVGDTKVDEAAARDAKVPFISYQNQNLAARYHIQRLAQIRDILENGKE